jgi:GntR family transcriptional regulator
MVDHESDVPVYIQLAGIIRDMITSGEIPPHKPIPSISYLVGAHGVADQTVKKAVQVLRDEGLVHTVTGKGVYVSESKD